MSNPIVALFAVFYVALAVVALIRPKWGVYLIWVATWGYPLGLLQGLLPFNVRFDDLFILWLVLCVGLLHRKPSGSHLILTLIVLLFIARVISNTVGVVTGPIDPLTIIRHLGKAFYIPAIAFVVWKTTHSVADVRGHLGAILIGGIVAAVIGTMEVLTPELTRMWEIPDSRYESAAFGIDHRRGGGALGPIYFAWTMMVIALLALRVFLRGTPGPLRTIAGVAAAVALPGLLASKTRSAIGGIVVAITYMLIRQRHRVLLIAAFLVFGMYLTFGTSLLDQAIGRFERVAEGGNIASGRFEIWSLYLFERPSIHYLLLGRGWPAEKQRLGVEAHSAYIGMFAYSGLTGSLLLIALFTAMWTRASMLLRGSTDPLDLAIAEALRAIILGTLFASLFGEELFKHQLRAVGAIAVLCEALIHLRRIEWWQQSQISKPEHLPAFPARQT